MLELRPDHDLKDLLRAGKLARSTFYYQAQVHRRGDNTLSSRLRSDLSTSFTKDAMAIGVLRLNSSAMAVM